MTAHLIIDGCNPSRWAAPEPVEHMLAGGVAAANATVAIWEGFSETVEEMGRWQRRFREQPHRILQVLQAADIERAHREGVAGIILGWQNLAPIENDLERLDVFHALGLRIAQLAYNYRNLIADGSFEPGDGGLSLFGRRTVTRMNELGILIDLSHVGDRSTRDAIDASEQPVAFTHANLRELYDSPRNKPALLVRALVERGGVIGANAFPQFLPSEFDADLAEYLDGIERLIEVAGIEHVGIASDFCEGHGDEFWRYLGRIHGTTPFFDIKVPKPTITGLESSAELPAIAAGLSDRGYSEQDVAGIMGGNWLRLFREVWGS